MAQRRLGNVNAQDLANMAWASAKREGLGVSPQAI